MKRGLIRQDTEWTFELSLSSSYTASGSLFKPIHGASLITHTCPSYFSREVSLQIDLFTTSEELPTYPDGKNYVGISLPGIYTYTSVLTGYDVSLSAKVKFIEPKVYAQLSGWRVDWDSIQLYDQGVLVHTVASGSVEGGYLAPAGLPFIGIPPFVGCQAAFNPAPILGPVTASTTVGSDSLEAQSTCTGTWTMSGTGLPYYLQVLPPDPVCAVPDYPSYTTGPGTLTLSSEASITRTVTDEGLVECNMCTNGPAISPQISRLYKTVLEWERTLGHVILLPNLPKSIKRGNEDYASLIVRGGMPRTRMYTSSMCQDFIADTIEHSNSYSEIHPRQSNLLTVLRNSPNPAEDTLGYKTYAPHGFTGMRFTGIGYATTLVSAGACPVAGFEEPPGTFTCTGLTPEAEYATSSSNFVGSEDAWDNGNPDMLRYIHHDEQDARYVNYWASPHWSYYYYFPPDEAEDPHSWNIEGDVAPPSLYWIPLGDQHLKNPYLPAGGPKNRTSLISAPLLESGLAGFMYWSAPIFRSTHNIRLL